MVNYGQARMRRPGGISARHPLSVDDYQKHKQQAVALNPDHLVDRVATNFNRMHNKPLIVYSVIGLEGLLFTAGLACLVAGAILAWYKIWVKDPDGNLYAYSENAFNPRFTVTGNDYKDTWEAMFLRMIYVGTIIVASMRFWWMSAHMYAGHDTLVEGKLFFVDSILLGFVLIFTIVLATARDHLDFTLAVGKTVTTVSSLQNHEVADAHGKFDTGFWLTVAAIAMIGAGALAHQVMSMVCYQLRFFTIALEGVEGVSNRSYEALDHINGVAADSYHTNQLLQGENASNKPFNFA